jgi:recombinational DNA repair protein RecR
MYISYYSGKFNSGDGLRMVSAEELRCVVCGKKLRGESCKIYRSPANEELKLCVCSEHEDYINALDSLKLPSKENNP